jgi:hypothetical protein
VDVLAYAILHLAAQRVLKQGRKQLGLGVHQAMGDYDFVAGSNTINLKDAPQRTLLPSKYVIQPILHIEAWAGSCA